MPDERLSLNLDQGLGHCVTSSAKAFPEARHWNDNLHNIPFNIAIGPVSDAEQVSLMDLALDLSNTKIGRTNVYHR